MNSFDCQCFKAQLESLSTSPVNISMERGDFETYHHISSLAEEATLEFNVVPSSKDCLAVRTLLYLQVKIVKANEEAINVNDKVAPTNLLLHSLSSS